MYEEVPEPSLNTQVHNTEQSMQRIYFLNHS